MITESPKSWMFIASILGSAAGIYYTSIVNPLNNYFVFMAIFVLVGFALANVVLMVLHEVYGWLKQYYSDVETAQVPQTA
jgi:hypothetical protein